MKNGGLIGILFILTGILFLLNNLNILDVSLIEIVKVYWPVILIWLGVDKLLRSK
jgi:lia operon protein LiaF